MMGYPTIGSVWRHRNGNIYTVLVMANTEGTDPSKFDKYPPMVVYQGQNGKVWARRFDDWHRSMVAQ